MYEIMNMATKVSFVMDLGSQEEIKSCINEKGQWSEACCDRVLLAHGFRPVELGLEPSPDYVRCEDDQDEYI